MNHREEIEAEDLKTICNSTVKNSNTPSHAQRAHSMSASFLEDEKVTFFADFEAKVACDPAIDASEETLFVAF